MPNGIATQNRCFYGRATGPRTWRCTADAACSPQTHIFYRWHRFGTGFSIFQLLAELNRFVNMGSQRKTAASTAVLLDHGRGVVPQTRLVPTDVGAAVLR